MKVIAVSVWISLFCALAFFALPRYEVREHLQARALGNIDTADISRLWFTQGDELVGIGQPGSHINIHVWASGNGSPLRDRSLDLPTTKQLPDPIYAISRDASKLAWISTAGVHVEDAFPAAQPVASNHPFRRPVAITSLALTGPNALAALYNDAQLELCNLSTNIVTVSRPLSFNEPGPLLSNGAYLAASSLASRDVFVFDVGTGDKLSVLEYSKYPQE